MPSLPPRAGGLGPAEQRTGGGRLCRRAVRINKCQRPLFVIHPAHRRVAGSSLGGGGGGRGEHGRAGGAPGARPARQCAQGEPGHRRAGAAGPFGRGLQVHRMCVPAPGHPSLSPGTVLAPTRWHNSHAILALPSVEPRHFMPELACRCSLPCCTQAVCAPALPCLLGADPDVRPPFPPNRAAALKVCVWAPPCGGW